jgi:ribosomal protein L37AE/L43A
MSLISQLQADFEQFLFVESDENHWSPDENTVFYAKNDKINLLHELGHALCGHKKFVQDVELLHIERDAWEKAVGLGQKYGVKISTEQIETALDGYRNWLHDRSICPNCSQNGVQQRSDRRYRCLNCDTIWTANDGRNARTHRYIQK